MASRRQLYSDFSEWTIIIIATVVAFALSEVNPDFHHFSVLDLTLSYPYRARQKVSKVLLVFLAVVVPVLVIAIVCLWGRQRLEIRSSRSAQSIEPSTKLSYLNTSLLGLGVSLATTTVIVTGVKNLTGKPRPNFLAICRPDLPRIASHTTGGYGQSISNLWVVVDGGICQQADTRVLNDGFRSFPSGYAAASFAGLWYLTLFLSAAFDILPHRGARSSVSRETRTSPERDENESTLLSGHAGTAEGDRAKSSMAGARPAYLLPVPYIPLGLAIFISGTRYFDFTNHGFDVLAGAGIGAVTAWFGYRWYNPALM